MKIQVIGTRFGRMTIVARAPNSKRWRKRQYTCLCACGKIVVVMWRNLRSGNTRSCGCLKKELATIHGESKAHPREYRAWTSMNWRCSPDNHDHRKDYYERGICVEYKPWRTSCSDFIAYVLTHLGHCPPGYVLDRIDNDQGYKPGNIRWASQSESNTNRRR